ncbi:Crp/Fnr family transcriptional regulator [Sphingosinicella rhizophila]|uniref:Crp/Fnr family transcriptional regulator n=1 Tax=Sphingosinicella rhizophila TaxID=3050082 RepID=A0ABU3QC32_9SPHN|nr:Crp/Fnr family transcriptional regulator [Sphingosinicella sp. GR2756]MDT9600505.1 Crp/Fnr family transcriptional regulator [Sphingosinicella sp. GR2756]
MTYSTFDMFQWMDAEAASAFQEAAFRRDYAAGQVIYLQGDHGQEMFRLVSGSVRMSVSRSDGREIVHAFFEPGDCFGDSSMVDFGPRPQTAEAHTDIVVDVIDMSNFVRLRDAHRTFGDAMLKLLARQMRAACMYFEEASLDDMSARVARRILDATRSFGTDADGGKRLSLRLPQADIAHMVGASRQSVNKVLQRFQCEGLITIEYGNILVHDLEGIRRAVGCELPS